MTNQERAEKILDSLVSTNEEDGYGDYRTNLEIIEDQLDEAVREVENFQAMRIIEVEKHCADNAFKYGFAAAREKAAGIVVWLKNSYTQNAHHYLKALEAEERIRAMTPTSSGEAGK